MLSEPRHRSQSILSHRTNSTWREDVFGRPRKPRGAMVFTGPDSLRMHRQTCRDPEYVGEGNWGWTPERTSSASYLLRAAPGTPHPRPKSAYRDAYGWGAWGTLADLCTWRNSGHHIKLGTFRQQLESDATHRFQNPWCSEEGHQSIGESVEKSQRPNSKDTTSTSAGRMLSQRPRQNSNNNLLTATHSNGSQQSLVPAD